MAKRIYVGNLPWSYSSSGSVSTFSAALQTGSYSGGTVAATYIAQATTIAQTGSGAVFQVKVDGSGVVVAAPTLLVGGYGYSTSPASTLKLFKEQYGSSSNGDITITVTALLANTPGQSAVMVTTPCASSCNNAVPTSVGDGTYTGAYTLNTMPPGAAYAGAYFRAFLAVKGGLMATFYSALSVPSPVTASLGSEAYTPAETRIVHGSSAAFTCASACYAGARFHGFIKATSSCSVTVYSGTARTYISGQIVHDAWDTASAPGSALAGNCADGKYVEIYHESRKGTSGTTHTMAELLFLQTTNDLATTNLYAAYAIANTPVPLTVTR